MIKKYFDILGIAPTRDEKVIKRAYRKKALEFHPDRNASKEANKQFIKITEAYDILLKVSKLNVDQTKSQSKGKQYSFNDFKKSKDNNTAQARFEERLKKAKLRYEYLKKKEEEENERYYAKISKGVVWGSFKLIMYGSLLMSLLFILDSTVLPSRWVKDRVTHGNEQLTYAGLNISTITPIVTKKNNKAWIKSVALYKIQKCPDVFLEKTFFFRDIKRVWIWEEERWLTTETDFSVTGSFPFISIILLLPFITSFLKGRTFIYSFLFNICLYFHGFFLLFLLYSNDRWAHILSLGII